jgi:hypothetical protein
MRLLRSLLSYLSAALLFPLQHPSWKPGGEKEWYPIPLPQLKLDLLLLLKQLWLLVRKAAREYPKYYNYHHYVLSLMTILLKKSSLSLHSS